MQRGAKKNLFTVVADKLFMEVAGATREPLVGTNIAVLQCIITGCAMYKKQQISTQNQGPKRYSKQSSKCIQRIIWNGAENQPNLNKMELGCILGHLMGAFELQGGVSGRCRDQTLSKFNISSEINDPGGGQALCAFRIMLYFKMRLSKNTMFWLKISYYVFSKYLSIMLFMTNLMLHIKTGCCLNMCRI